MALAALKNALRLTGRNARRHPRGHLRRRRRRRRGRPDPARGRASSDLAVIDRKGVLNSERADLTPVKRALAVDTADNFGRTGSLADVLDGADVYIGVSGGTVPEEVVATMADDAIIFGLANPNPEVHPDVAHRHARVVATGRSDFPNQINNVLAFPGIFRGAFDVHATAITEGMKLAAADALADLVGDDLAEDMIIPVAVRPAGRAARSPRLPCAEAARRRDGVAAPLGSAACSPSTPRPSPPTTRCPAWWWGSGPTRSSPTAGPPSPSRPPRSTTTTSGRCAASGCKRGGAADDPRLRRGGLRRGRQRGRRARGDQRPGLDRATRPSTRGGRCSPSATRAPSPTGSPCPRRNVVPKPASLSFEEAACLPTAWLTAYRMLFTQGGLKAGDTVLVQGAGGGVATALIMLARAGGLRVLATSRDEAKRARALEIGAHEVFESGARLPVKVDAVMETVGRATWSHSIRALRPGGTIVISGTTSGPKLDDAELTRIFFLQLRVIGSTMGTRDELAALVDAARRHRRPAADRPRRCRWSRPRDGFAAMAEGDVFGKIVFTR